MPTTTSLPDDGLVHLKTVLSVIQIGRSAWYAGIRAGKFPPPVKVGTRSLWKVSEIRALINSLSRGETVPPKPPKPSPVSNVTRRRGRS
jgi:prophage regulatory protein